MQHYSTKVAVVAKHTPHESWSRGWGIISHQLLCICFLSFWLCLFVECPSKVLIFNKDMLRCAAWVQSRCVQSQLINVLMQPKILIYIGHTTQGPWHIRYRNKSLTWKEASQVDFRGDWNWAVDVTSGRLDVGLVLLAEVERAERDAGVHLLLYSWASWGCLEREQTEAHS